MSEKTWYVLFRGTQYPISEEEATEFRVLTSGTSGYMFFDLTVLGQKETVRIQPVSEASLVQL